MTADSLVERFLSGEMGTSDVVDNTDDFASCEMQLRSYGGRRRFSGRIRTVKVYDDNALVKQTLSTPGEGAVLVVDGGCSMRSALIGDIIAGLGVDNGWAGAIVFGVVRDVEALAKLDFGLLALGSNPRKSTKIGTGVRDVDVEFPGVVFRPGKWVLADADGVIVLH
jgi:regulator of ribonuclease activity A